MNLTVSNNIRQDSCCFTSSRFNKFLTLVLCLVAASLFSGCGTLRVVRLKGAVPVALQKEVKMPGMPGVRAWADDADSLKALFHGSKLKVPDTNRPMVVLAGNETVDILAISGGGGDGAYGAGLLCGWTRAGNRPKFRVVTGISTGALMAPFAFLGPDYDEELKQCYTTISSKDVFRIKGTLRILFGDSLADTEPLSRLTRRNFTDEMIAEIALEHKKGRRLYVGTANLDAQRQVIWDMGAIACYAVEYETNQLDGNSPVVLRKFNRPAVDLFRRVLIASASIPVAFPPQYFSVEVNHKLYDEMHVDGGTCNQVFLCGDPLEFSSLSSAEKKGGVRIFVIRNGHINPEFEHVTPLLKNIAARSIATLIKSQGLGDLLRIHALADQKKSDFNLAFIPEEVACKRKDEFDREIMHRLFDVGYIQAKGGYPWKKEPPSVDLWR
jgi:hypothetical protein